MSVILEANNLKAYYMTQAYGVQHTVKAVDDISVQIKEVELFGIVGESGCGKSTLLKVLLGAHQPPLTVVGGSVNYCFDGQELDALSMSDERRRELRWKKVSYIPQGSM